MYSHELLAIARRFAAALDAEDYSAARLLLADGCAYHIGDRTIVGPDAIVESYRVNAESASGRFDLVEYFSNVEISGPSSAVISFCDRLRLGSETHEFRCRQHVRIGLSGLVEEIRHEELPGERKRLEEFEAVARESLSQSTMSEYLGQSDVVDWGHPAIMRQAQALSGGGDATVIAKSCFEWVRDEVRHSRDARLNPVTWRASDVLLHRTGYCFAKSHLLAALLRANRIPTGFCYQRLRLDGSGPPYSLHGFNAIKLPDHGWYRVDARGNRAGVDAQFCPPQEQIAFRVQAMEEADFLEILPEPLSCVVNALRKCSTWQEGEASLPDVRPEEFESLGLTKR